MSEAKIAVLIDAENDPLPKENKPSGFCAAMEAVSKLGRVLVKRAYGDWQNAVLKNWIPVMNQMSIKEVQQPRYVTGKNAADMALVIDAMDLLHSGLYDTFVIFSSDSDFTPLAVRLRESGAYVIGAGKETTPDSFRYACDDFLSTDDAPAKKAAASKAAKLPAKQPAALKEEAKPQAKQVAAPKDEVKPQVKQASPKAEARPQGQQAAAPKDESKPQAKQPAPKAEPKPQGKQAAASKEEAKPQAKQAAPKAEDEPHAKKAAAPKEAAAPKKEVISQASQVPAKAKAEPVPGPMEPEVPAVKGDIQEVHALIRTTFENYQRADGYVNAALLGNFIKRKKPDFNCKDYGFKLLSQLLEAYPEKYEVIRTHSGGEKPMTVISFRCLD